MSEYSRVARSILTLGVGQVLTWVGSALLLVLLPRYLGDVNLGRLAFASAVTALCGLAADLGATTFLARDVARDPSRLSALTKAVLVTRLPLGAAAALLAAAFAWVAGYDEPTRAIVYVLSVGMMIGAFTNTFGASLQGLQRMRALTASMVVGKLVQSALIAALLLNGAGVLEIAIVTVFANAIGLGIGSFALRRDLRWSAPVKPGMMRLVIVGGLPFFVWQAALVVYGQIDFVLLSVLTRDAVVGWYAAAYRIIMLPSFLPTIVTTAALPALSAMSRDPQRFAALARRSVELIALTTMPLAFGILVLPDRLVQSLGYPGNFMNSIAPMMLLALHIPLAGIDMVIGTVLGTIDRQRSWATAGIAAAFLNPAANAIAIPFTEHVYGNGAIGAALVTTLTELFMLAVGLRLLPGGLARSATFLYVLKCVAAASLMATVVLALRDLPLVAIVLIGGVAYGTASLLLRTLSLSDLRVIRAHLLALALPLRRIAPERVGG